ncbi:MMPL/RND family transporter [Mycolicibacterium thermoresistibile]
MGTRETTAPAGFFGWLGDVVVRFPLIVIGLWIGLAVVLTATVPPLQEVAAKNPVSVLPDDAPVMVTTREMTAAFEDSGGDNLLLVVMTDDDGLGPDDEEAYAKLVSALDAESNDDIMMMQDFITTPQLREVVASEDGKAWYLPINLAGGWATPEGGGAFSRVAETVRQATADAPMSVYLTGPAATIADVTVVGQRDIRVIEIATVGMVLAILLLVYRNVVTMLMPLITIGVAFVCAQGLVGALAPFGMGVSDQTIVLMTGIMVGAGVDYAVFLISRYHDFVRRGVEHKRAIRDALASIGKVIGASAATVAVTFFAMIFTTLSVFQTVGPAMALAIFVCFSAAVTFLPAMIVLAGPRGWVSPRRDLTTRFWRRSGIRIVRAPKTHLAVSLVVLLALAGCALLVQYNYDDRKTLPDSVESAAGYAAMERHYPINSNLPQYLFITSPRDLRTPEALADLEEMARRVSQLPDVDAVRGITRPTGEPLEQAQLSYQAGEVGGRLDDASRQVTDHTGDLDMLADGAHQLADALGDVRGQVFETIATTKGLVDALTGLQQRFGGERTLDDIDNAARLASGMRELGDAIGVNVANIAGNLEWAVPVLTALDTSPVCSAKPRCVQARDDLRQLVNAGRQGVLDRIALLGRQLEATQGGQTIDETLEDLSGTLTGATSALRSAGLDRPGGLQAQIATAQEGADALADASRKLAEGVQLLVNQTKEMGSGLGEASSFLLAMKRDATTPAMGGFYIPPEVLTQEDFQKAAEIFVSPDGHAVRYLVTTKLNPFSTEAMDQVNEITDTALGARANTELAESDISMAGFTTTLRDTRDFYNNDFRLITVLTVLIVFLILVALLRAIVAPLYLITSVVISYLSALGLGVILFQFILGQELSWSVPGLTFIILVAVGADYNMLLISRIREESPHGIRSGIIRTVGYTGGVITSAGLIFAASMFGLLFASVTTMIQAGFILGIGLLLDTFLVRTITVPAIAVLVGRFNWWPARPSNLDSTTAEPAAT